MTPTSPPTRPRVTVPAITAMKAAGSRIAMITAYDATFARLVDEAGVDMILVGDSLGMVVQGEAHTIPVDLDEMAYHVRTVARADTLALVVGDLPFGSYQVSPQQAVESSIRLMKAGAGCVKLEGGVAMADTIDAITRVDIPVVGHIGLTPQSYHRMGGHKVQGRRTGSEAGGRDRLIEDAFAVEQAGAFAVVIEGVPRSLAAEITAKVSIPTIGIGAGPDCDGQVLVLHDVLGLSDLAAEVRQALRRPPCRDDRRHHGLRRRGARRRVARRRALLPLTSMEVLATPESMRAWSHERHRAGRTIGFVPTMGALHDGHLSLVAIAEQRCDDVVVSIFVNALQFDRAADFDAYPRPIDDDVARCAEVGVDAVYAPTTAAMYPPGFETHVEPGSLGDVMEGAARRGHFRGVTTVVTKLFAAVRPDVGVFGEKDFQQLAIIRRMTADLDLGIEIVGAPIVREADGLAMSSRNLRLSAADREAATCIPLALDAVVADGGGRRRHRHAHRRCAGRGGQRAAGRIGVRRHLRPGDAGPARAARRTGARGDRRVVRGRPTDRQPPAPVTGPPFSARASGARPGDRHRCPAT